MQIVYFVIEKNKEPWLNRLRTYEAENLDNCHEQLQSLELIAVLR